MKSIFTLNENLWEDGSIINNANKFNLVVNNKNANEKSVKDDGNSKSFSFFRKTPKLWTEVVR